MEKILAIVGALTLLIGALTTLVKTLNYFIKESSLVANSIWELKKYKLKRIKKDGSTSLIN